MAEQQFQDVVIQSQSGGEHSPSDVPAATKQFSTVEGEEEGKSSAEEVGGRSNIPSESSHGTMSTPNDLQDALVNGAVRMGLH